VPITASLKNTFGTSVPKSQKKTKHPPPVSIRFTDEERKRLDRGRGKLSLSAYIRQKLFGDTTAPRKRQYQKKQRQPDMDAKTLARLLGTFGQSELATSMLALALAAQSGDLPVTPELSEKLNAACDDIHEMRECLIVALGIKAERGK